MCPALVILCCLLGLAQGGGPSFLGVGCKNPLVQPQQYSGGVMIGCPGQHAFRNRADGCDEERGYAPCDITKYLSSLSKTTEPPWYHYWLENELQFRFGVSGACSVSEGADSCTTSSFLVTNGGGTDGVGNTNGGLFDCSFDDDTTGSHYLGGCLGAPLTASVLCCTGADPLQVEYTNPGAGERGVTGARIDIGFTDNVINNGDFTGGVTFSCDSGGAIVLSPSFAGTEVALIASRSFPPNSMCTLTLDARFVQGGEFSGLIEDFKLVFYTAVSPGKHPCAISTLQITQGLYGCQGGYEGSGALFSQAASACLKAPVCSVEQFFLRNKDAIAPYSNYWTTFNQRHASGRACTAIYPANNENGPLLICGPEMQNACDLTNCSTSAAAPFYKDLGAFINEYPRADTLCCPLAKPSFVYSSTNDDAFRTAEGDIISIAVTFSAAVHSVEFEMNGVALGSSQVETLKTGSEYIVRVDADICGLSDCIEYTLRVLFDDGQTSRVEIYRSASQSQICTPNQFGRACEDTCSCFHGYCDNGVRGDGTCFDCWERTGWAAADCDFCVGTIGPSFSGWVADAACATCAGQFYGPDCIDSCSCNVNATCNTGLDGDGFCTCVNGTGLTGPSCDECSGNYAGPACDQPCTCHPTQGVCDNIEGLCATCAPGFYGENCDEACSCVNGVCDDDIDGTGLCLTCTIGTGWVGPNCNECDAGYGGSTCKDICDPGYYSPRGNSTCFPCPEGTAQANQQSSQCAPCLPGQFQPAVGQANCRSCPPGQYSLNLSSTSCTVCADGRFNPGLAVVDSDFACAPCPAGEISSSDRSACVQCEPGTYRPANASILTCLRCPAGTSTSQFGSSRCRECPPGSYQSAEGRSTCAPCGEGTYARVNGSRECDDCPGGTESATTGQLECTVCGLGRQRPVFARRCLPCPHGYYNDDNERAELCKPCGPGSYAATLGSISCAPCELSYYAEVPGTANCSACPESTETLLKGARSIQECSCRASFYRGAPEDNECTSCPPGGECLGGERAPRAGPGHFASPENALEFVLCSPREACANGGCTEGYKGFKCGECDAGFYHLAGKCDKCPRGVSWRMIVGIPVMLAATAAILFFVYQFHRGEKADVQLRRHRFAMVTTGLNFIQILAIFGEFDLAWPGPVRFLLTFFSAFNLNLDLLATECTAVGTTYTAKYIISMLMPVLIILALVAMFALTKALRKIPALSEKVPDIEAPMLASAFVTSMSFCFVFVVAKSFAPFDCTKEGSYYTMDDAPSYYCFQRSAWFTLLPFALLGILIYSVAFPAGLLFALVKMSRTPDEASVWYTSLGFIIQRFEQRFYHWEVFIMVRKAAIVLCVLFFSKTPVVQAFLAQVVLAISLAAHQYYWPYKLDVLNRLEVSLLFVGLLVLLTGQVCFSIQQQSSVEPTDDIIEVEQREGSEALVEALGWIMAIIVVGSLVFCVVLTGLSAALTGGEKKKQKTAKPVEGTSSTDPTDSDQSKDGDEVNEDMKDDVKLDSIQSANV